MDYQAAALNLSSRSFGWRTRGLINTAHHRETWALLEVHVVEGQSCTIRTTLDALYVESDGLVTCADIFAEAFVPYVTRPVPPATPCSLPGCANREEGHIQAER
eukprot:3520617-Amphidinium_carterae.2